MDSRKITLALTTYNRFDLLVKCFEQVIDDDRISEIVIVDDHSKTEIFEKILCTFNRYKKISVYRNNENLGVYKNKRESVYLSSNDWVIVFDSDNVIGKDYIDTLYALGDWHNVFVYCPAFARPKFDYRQFAGKMITKTTAAELFTKKQFDCLINTMNCFVHRDTFLSVFDPDTEPVAADSAYFNYRWLMAGYAMYVVPGLEYEHLIHPGSHYVQNIKSSNAFHAKMMNAFKNMK